MTTMTPPTDTPPPPPSGPPPAGPPSGGPPPVGPPLGGPPPGWGGPPPGPPPTAPTRRLQRSRSERVAGGVAGGLGEYFGLDPVLFRVLFAVAAFFGGFGVLAYVILWFALPESGDLATSPVDRLGAWLKAHNVPLWLAGLVGVVAFWIVVGGFGGWAFDGFFFPGAAVIGVVLLIVAFSRRGATSRSAGLHPTHQGPFAPPAAGGAPDADRADTAPTVSLDKPLYDDLPTDERPMNAWFNDAREKGRARRRRARPLFLTTLAALVVGLATVVVIDAATGVALPVYAVVGGAIVLLGLLVGIVARRPAFSLIWFLVPALVWLAAFAGTHTSMHDGAGEVAYRPTSAAELDDDYRLAFGRITLDLRDVYAGSSVAGGTTTADVPDRVVVRVGAGVARVLVPDDARVTVLAQVRLGTVLVDGQDERGARRDGSSGWRTTTQVAPTGSVGPPLLVVLQVTDGAAAIEHAS